jgi:glycosyltransferase involved in cell wall biosynthesis
MQKPCITSDTTGCNDIVVDGLTGYLCKVKDEKDLQLQMEKMLKLTKEERGAMGVKAREIMKTKFAKQIVVDAYVKAVESV